MKQIPMLDLKREYEYMKTDIDSAIKKCLDEQKWILGPEVKELEDKIAEYIGVKHCIGVSSGTEALVLALRAIAIQLKGEEYFSRDDEIITTPFTFTATGDAILRSGATPVFVDIDPATYNIDSNKIREYLTQNSTNVVGMIPVHLYGQACNMDEITDIAQKHELFVVEDVAQAFGGAWRGKKLGSTGTAGTFSFFPSKNLGGFGDGGMISTNDEQISELIRMLLKHGGKDKYNVDHIGYNARLDTLQAAILLAKLKFIDDFNARRKKIASIYHQELSSVKGITLPTSQISGTTRSSISHSTDDCVYHQYTMRIHNNKRNDFQEFLKEEGISTMVYYPVPLHKMKVFAGKMKVLDSLNNSIQATQEVCSLPIEPLQESEDTSYIIAIIKQFFKT
ncbi:MAG: DegT/DnrJ/EryC1/StrS family aminotransferase [Candidatus Scalindua sp.]|nr:DegT/DnrJ/EryC1/StrS family aminotransferase [Candidatus Scalindua sp.]